MTEYVILAAFLIIGLAAVFAAFPNVIARFAWEVAKVLGCPLI